ncbi:uncharacterized protein LOC135825691 isoform X2 [Sycon ciliatum]|uniref:uncharacterized protein LOC135825691 isoform X2 n=1 Tax=Sycon ciliatum TaxID=27933 RepID=UPI0031F5FA7B
MAQVTCANLAVKGTSAVWVGLTGTWTAGNWSAWKWEVASSTRTTRLPWSSEYTLPVKNSSYTYGYLDPNKGLVNWINNFQIWFLCQRYVPKDNWYVCSMSKSLGLMEILYISTPKTFDEATTECAGRGSILANLQSINHTECARSVLGPRNGQCNSSSGDNCRTASSGCETNTCNVWVALQRPSKKWTWVLPVPSIPSTIPWRNSTTGGSGERKCGYYSPEEEGFGIDSCTMKLSFYCQRYTPNAPSNITVNSTETEISARILQPHILREWITGFCFAYGKNSTNFTTSVCDTNVSTVFGKLSSNTLYRVRAFYNTTIGIHSSVSPEVYIGTLPKAPKPPLEMSIFSSAITVLLSPIEVGSLPILQYCAYGKPAIDQNGNLPSVSACSVSNRVTLTGLTINTTYIISTYISNEYGDSDQSISIRITTLPPAQTTTSSNIFSMGTTSNLDETSEQIDSGISVGGFVGGTVAAILTVIVAVALVANRKRIARWFSSKAFKVSDARHEEADPIELHQNEGLGRNVGGQPERLQNLYQEAASPLSNVPENSYAAVGANNRDGNAAEAESDMTGTEYSNVSEEPVTVAPAAGGQRHPYAQVSPRKKVVKSAESDSAVLGAEDSNSREELARAAPAAGGQRYPYAQVGPRKKVVKSAESDSAVLGAEDSNSREELARVTANDEEASDITEHTPPVPSKALRNAVSGTQLPTEVLDSAYAEVEPLHPSQMHKLQSKTTKDEDASASTEHSQPVPSNAVRNAVSGIQLSSESTSNSQPPTEVVGSAYAEVDLLQPSQLRKFQTKLSQPNIGSDNVYNTLGECLSPTVDENIDLNYDVLDRSKMMATSLLTTSQVPKDKEERKRTSYVTISNPKYDVAADPLPNTSVGNSAEHIYDTATDDGLVPDRKQG